MTGWSDLGTAAATVLASGSIAAVVSHFLTGSRERRGLLRQKAEDLYISVEALENSWSQGAVGLNRLVIGSINYDQYSDLIIGRGEKEDGSLNRRVEMLTRIYFPKTVPRLEAVRSALNDFHVMRQVHKAAYLDGTPEAISWETDFAPIVRLVASNFEAYKLSVVRCAQSSFTPMRIRDA